jgi:N-acetylmuramoyl-L-alanine amidase
MNDSHWIAPLVAAVLVIGLAPAAVAGDGRKRASAPGSTEDPVAITLEASRRIVTYGGAVRLTGEVDPPMEGARVEIAEEDGASVGETVTDAGGRFSFEFTPKQNVRLVAKWATVTSDPVRVRVRPTVNVRLSAVRLFARATVSGRVQPALPGHTVKVTLKRNGSAYRSRNVTADGTGRFRVRFRIGKPGVFRAIARYGGTSLARSRDGSSKRRTALPSLRPGSRGEPVQRLERRLRDLGYYLPGADRSYDEKTSDAVIAFNKIQERARVGTVDEATWRALASPVRARPRVRSNFHIEIDQTRQVILVVKKRKVRWIVHTSTGRNGYTHDGVYAVNRKISGYSGGRLYYPSYFDGLRAIHGWPEVPTQPASHGCARIPMWAARWMHGLADMGTKIRVYH